MSEYKCEVNTDGAKEYLGDLTEKERAKILQLIERLKEQGGNLPKFNSNWAKVVKGSRYQPELLELRATIGPSIIRIAYYVDTEANIAYLLWGGDKKGQNEKRFYKRLIREGDRAIESMREDKLKKLKKEK